MKSNVKRRLAALERRYGRDRDIVTVTERSINPDGTVVSTLTGQCTRAELEAACEQSRAEREQLARRLHGKEFDPHLANGLELELRGRFDLLIQKYDEWRTWDNYPMDEAWVREMEELKLICSHVDGASDTDVLATIGQGLNEGWLWIEAGLVHSVTAASHPDTHAHSDIRYICFWQRVAQRLNRICEQRGVAITSLLLLEGTDAVA
jgi:hypothetical protein